MATLCVTPIGVNSAFTVRGFQTGFLLSCGKTRLLVDCGSTAGAALHRLGLRLSDIENVYVSHLHLDHTAGLFELAVTRLHMKRKPPRIFTHRDIAPTLWDGFLRTFLEHYVTADGKPRTASVETYFDIVSTPDTWETSAQPFVAGDINLRLVPTKHMEGMPSYGIIVNDKVFLSTDATFSPDQLEKIADRFGIEAIFHDCAFRPELAAVHATYEQLLTLPEDLRQLVIGVHYEDSASPDDSSLKIALARAGQEYTFEV